MQQSLEKEMPFVIWMDFTFPNFRFDAAFSLEYIRGIVSNRVFNNRIFFLEINLIERFRYM